MLIKLFWLFVRLGFLSIGGGYPMMALILQEGEAAVGLTSAEFADMAALELLASGPIALNAATYIGYIKAGILGSLVATAGACVPPFVLTTVLYYFLNKYRENKYVKAFLEAIKVACGGVLLTTAFTLGRQVLLGGHGLAEVAAAPLALVSWGGVIICGLCLLASLKWKTNPVFLVLGSAVAGGLLMR